MTLSSGYKGLLGKKTLADSRKVCVVTGSRSEYGLLRPILRAIHEHPALNLQLVVAAAHLSDSFGQTIKEVERDGFEIDARVNNLLNDDSAGGIAKSAGLATSLVADHFQQLKPDVVVLLGDRFETLGVCMAALLMKIPVAHIHGGEITRGAIDDSIRHAITKMSYLHFTSTNEYRNRVIQLGESPDRVFCTGAPGLDAARDLQLLTRAELEASLTWEFGPKSALVTYHPETVLDPQDDEETLIKIFDCLTASDARAIFTYSNADQGGRQLNDKMKELCSASQGRFRLVESLGRLRYWSAMNQVDLIVGNSSSGIIEAASLGKPVVNIGARQSGRLQSGNVINCDRSGLEDALERGFSQEYADKVRRTKNIYGDGHAASRIVRALLECRLSVQKEFYDL